MKVGILGGTFDPIHNAHIEIAKTALNQFNLDKVMIMPTPNPPHKDKNTITSNFHRINMIKLAILPYENIEFSDFEINMHDVTYTADTLYLLNELNPDIEYYFILFHLCYTCIKGETCTYLRHQEKDKIYENNHLRWWPGASPASGRIY